LFDANRTSVPIPVNHFGRRDGTGAARRSEIGRLAHRGLGVRDFSLAAARTLRRAVWFDGVCVVTLDPATLLPTGHVIENGLPRGTLVGDST
jgi:hypothetical protein